MDAETLKALKGSIAKWQAIVDGTGVDEGSANCPLCQKFRFIVAYKYRCDGCPVREKTGEPDCAGSPYEDYSMKAHFTDEFIDEEINAAAQAELDFLISLLPEGETP